MQSIHCSNSENSNGGRIDAFIKRSILPLEIWPKRQCHNFDEIASIRLHFFVTFSCEEEFLFLQLIIFTFSDNESKYILSCRKARPTHSLLNYISLLPSPKWQSVESSSDRDTLIKFLLICTRWKSFLLFWLFLFFCWTWKTSSPPLAALSLSYFWLHMVNNFSMFLFSGWMF